MSEQKSKALSVLRETVTKFGPPNASPVSALGVRLSGMMRTMGWTAGPRRPLTIEDAIQLSAVLVCLDVLAQDIAKTTFRMYRRLPGKGKREVEAGEHHVAALLKTEPNRHHTWYEFFEMMMLHLGLAQNAFVAKRFSAGREREVEELIPCLPGRTTIFAVTPDRDTSGRGFYAYDVQRLTPHEKIQLSGLPDYFLEDEFIHFRGRMFDGLTGYSNLEAGAKTFGLANELVEYQTRLFRNDGQLRGVFQKPGEEGDALSDEAFEHLRDQLKEAMNNFRRENIPIVLEEGMQFQQISMNAEQAEVVKARDAAIVDVARNFRMPPHKIMHLVNVKYENMETLEKSYVQDTLLPYCRRVEPRLERSLLTKKERAEFFFEFDREEMVLTDVGKQNEFIKTFMQNGLMTIDEARSRRGLNPLPNKAGELRLIPSTYNAVDEKNEIVIPAGAQPVKDDKEEPADEGADDAKKEIPGVEFQDGIIRLSDRRP